MIPNMNSKAAVITGGVMFDGDIEAGKRALGKIGRGSPVGTRRLNGQNDLADMIRRLHERMSGRRLGKRECCMDHRVNASRFEHRPDVAADGIGDGCFLLHGS
jgi:hypothetical protein